MAIHIRAFQQALVVIEIIREIIFRRVRTAVERHILINNIACARHLVHPVGVGCVVVNIGKHSRIACQVDGVVSIDSHLVPIKIILFGPEIGLLTEVLCVEHLRITFLNLGSEHTSVFHSRLTAPSILRGDEHHSVGGGSSVDGSRGGVLQHLYALYVIGVYRVERIAVHARHELISGRDNTRVGRGVGLQRHTVHNIERRIAAVG